LKTTAFVFARGGSKGLPNKNLIQLNGKPLIAWAIEKALEVQRIDRVIVSTDSFDIAHVAKSYGAEVPFIRPSELATDESPEWKSWQHALSFVKESSGNYPECFVSIPPTSPLRESVDIDNCLDEYLLGKCDAVVSVTESRRNPYFNLVTKDVSGRLELISKPSENVARRQDAPVAFDLTTVCYVADPQFIMKAESLFQGKIHGVSVPIERSIDIDTMLDLEICQFLLDRKLKQND
jgi:N-acylneuraminate cytidylyltransferase